MISPQSLLRRLRGRWKAGPKEPAAEAPDTPAVVAPKPLFLASDAYSLLEQRIPTAAGMVAARAAQLKRGPGANGPLCYGEAGFCVLEYVFRCLRTKHGALLQDGGIFYDLGAGTAKPVFAAALLHQFDTVRGIELVDELWEQSLALKELWVGEIVPALRVPTNSAVIEVDLILGDMLHEDWSDGTVVFANLTCFGTRFLQEIARKADLLAAGSIFFSTTNPLPSDHWEILQVLKFSQNMGSTNRTFSSTMYVQRKKAPPCLSGSNRGRLNHVIITSDIHSEAKRAV